MIVDNLAISFKEQMDNGIYIAPFTGEMDDNYLVDIQHFLLKVKEEPDIRVPLREAYYMDELYKEFIESRNAKKLVYP